MSNSILAPCGHPGERIIGTYVRCLSGCEGAVAIVPDRGVPGHVVACACADCRFRRAATTIVLRNRKGESIASVPYDGKSTATLNWTGFPQAVVHFQILDKDGQVLCHGPVNPVWWLFPGCTHDFDVGHMTVRLAAYMASESLMDTGTQSKGSLPPSPEAVREWAAVLDGKPRDHQGELKTVRQAAKPISFDKLYRYAGDDAANTIDSVKKHAEFIAGADRAFVDQVLAEAKTATGSKLEALYFWATGWPRSDRPDARLRISLQLWVERRVRRRRTGVDRVKTWTRMADARISAVEIIATSPEHYTVTITGLRVPRPTAEGFNGILTNVRTEIREKLPPSVTFSLDYHPQVLGDFLCAVDIRGSYTV